MEIERKFLIEELPEDLILPAGTEFEQGYLCTGPVVRIRREGDAYWLTIKSQGMMIREEYNIPMSADAYYHLLPKVDHSLIHKTRFRIPLDETHTIELDQFHGVLAPLLMAEVEFTSPEDAEDFIPPHWFGREVTYDRRFHNSNMILLTYEDLTD